MPPDADAGPLRRAASDLALAVAFLTVLPVPARDPGERGLGPAAGWFALVGALVGGLAAAVRAVTESSLGAPAATVLALVVLVGVTGGLHQDGLADTFDGLGVRADRERRLRAMRDPATGVFGVLAVVGWALLMLTTLDSLSKTHAVAALVAAGALGRAAAVVHAGATPAGRPDGLGAQFAPGPAAAVAAAVSAVVVAIAACGWSRGLEATAAAAAIALGSIGVARRSFGGRTGDTLGAMVAIAEAVVCVALLAAWS